MSAQNDQEETLTELVVREAVGIGMESPMRESILEAVDEAEDRSSGSARSLPLAGGMFGLGAALGYLAGRESDAFETPSLEEFQAPEAVEDVEEQLGTASEESEETAEEEPSGSSRLPWLVIAMGAVAVIALLRRRRSGESEEEWEPIEEFEPVTDEEGESAEAGVDESGEE